MGTKGKIKIMTPNFDSQNTKVHIDLKTNQPH